MISVMELTIVHEAYSTKHHTLNKKIKYVCVKGGGGWGAESIVLLECLQLHQ